MYFYVRFHLICTPKRILVFPPSFLLIYQLFYVRQTLTFCLIWFCDKEHENWRIEICRGYTCACNFHNLQIGYIFHLDDEEENAEISYSFATEVLFTSSKMQR